MSKAGYNQKRWGQTRRAVLARDGYRCRECARYGKDVQADVVHHLIPIADGGPMWSTSNLISLCNSCHESAHGRGNGRELTQFGIDLIRDHKDKILAQAAKNIQDICRSLHPPTG